MGTKKSTNTFRGIDYTSEATPRATTPDGVPVFCVFDEIIPVEKAIPNPRNPNQHSTAQIQLLGGIIQATGWRTAITISRRSGFIVKGHGRLKAALAIGSKYVPADFQEYASEAEEYADLIADNRLAELSDLDTNMLADILGELDDGQVPLELTGYTEEDMSEILAALEGADDTLDDEADAVPDVPAIPMTRSGDLWTLGQHRLIELSMRAIDNSSLPGNLAIDFFGGSGSTLAGAELTGRRCFTIELAPGYCDVIVNRYVRLTGNIGVTCERGGESLSYAQLKAENDIINNKEAAEQQ